MRLQCFIEDMCEENDISYKDFLTTLGTFYKLGILKIIFCSNDKLNYEKAYKYLMDEWDIKDIPIRLRDVEYYLSILRIAKDKPVTVSSVISPNFKIKKYLTVIEDSARLVENVLFYRENSLDKNTSPVFKCGKVPDSFIDFMQRFVEVSLEEEFTTAMKYKLFSKFDYMDVFNKKILNYVKQYLRENNKDLHREALIYQLKILNVDSIIFELFYKTYRSEDTLYTFFLNDKALPPNICELYKNTLNDLIREQLNFHLEKYKKGETLKR